MAAMAGTPFASQNLMDSILIIKLSSVGDIVLSTPVVRHLRAITGARIVWLVDGGIAPLLEGHPDIDELLLFPRDPFAPFMRDGHRVIPKMARLVARLRSEVFDLAIDLQGRGRTYLLLQLCRARRKIGRGSFPLLAERVTHRRDVVRHAVDSYFEATDLLGIERPSNPRLVLPPGEQDRFWLDGRLKACGIDGPIVCLAPSTTWRSKLWPPEYWAKVADWLIAQGDHVVLIGSAGESFRADAILNRLGRPQRAISLCGSLSLRQLISLFERSRLVISVDTGPMHIAAATDTPLIGLFGPTDPARTGPWPSGRATVIQAPGCRCCRIARCRRDCMKRLLPDAVIAAASPLDQRSQCQLR